MTPDFLLAAMRPDMITDTEVEISTEECCEEEDEMVTSMEEPELDNEPVRKRRGTCEQRSVLRETRGRKKSIKMTFYLRIL